MLRDAHDANRRHWDAAARGWERLRDRDQLWRTCAEHPEVAFEGETLAFIAEFAGDLQGKRVCVIGSGDNYAALALAGLGADVTSTDISGEQLRVAEGRAGVLGLDITFVRCDAADLAPIDDAAFDLVCSTNGFLVWIAEPSRVFSAVHRILKPGGYYILCDIHPFMRPWKDQTVPIEMEKPYFDTGPYECGTSEEKTYEFHWTMGDLINGLLASGLSLRRMAETEAADSRFWQGYAYVPGTDADLLDWHHNSRAGLPVWLTVAAQKPRDTGIQCS